MKERYVASTRYKKGQWGLGSRSDKLWGGEEFIALRRHEVENSSSQEPTPSRWNMASVTMMSSLMAQQLLTVIKKAFGQVKTEFSFKTLKDFYSFLQFLASIWRWTRQQWYKCMLDNDFLPSKEFTRWKPSCSLQEILVDSFCKSQMT